MANDIKKSSFGSNRSTLPKAAALAMGGIAMASNAEAASIKDISDEIINTDVLVIGGGYAGVLAAIKAKDKGADVVLADKGYVGRSGSSVWAGSFSTFDPAGNQTRESFHQNAIRQDEYLYRKDYLDMWLDDSKAVGDLLTSWGCVGALNPGDIHREKLIKNNIRIVERLMITNLLEKNGQVIGAMGFPMEEDKAIIIKAKAVVLCTGAGAFKNSGFPIGPLTYDGQAMAYRLGAEISGKEWNDHHMVPSEHIDSVWYQYENHFNIAFGVSSGGAQGARSGGAQGSRSGGAQGARSGGAQGARSGGNARTGGRLNAKDVIFEAHKGNVPVLVEDILGEGQTAMGPNKFFPKTSVVVGSTAGEAPHRHDGLFPADDKCATNLTGLYAAGDAMFSGATSGTGMSSSGCAVQGATAGVSAAAFVKNGEFPVISDSEISNIKEQVFEPRIRAKGFSPSWVTQVIQNIMTPYYVLYVKKKERLEAALTNIKFLRDHFAPKLLANNTHQLRLAHETRNMILNAEMKLRASLFRTESRCTHYREDFPARSDTDWLAFVIIKQNNGKMELYKKDLPEDSKPDPKLTYEQKYNSRFPGEIEFLRKEGN